MSTVGITESDEEIQKIYNEYGGKGQLSLKQIEAIRKKPVFMKMLIGKSNSTKKRGKNKKKKEKVVEEVVLESN